jgi:hypothetical protein
VGVSVEVEELVMLVEADEGVDGMTVEEVLEEGVTVEEVLRKDES